MDLSLRRLALAAVDRVRARLDSSGASAPPPRPTAMAPYARAPARLDAGPSGDVFASPSSAHLDAACGSSGCGSLAGYGSRNWFGSPRELLEYQGGLSWELIDWLCVDELMRKIATLLPEDACAVRPELTGPALGELDDVWLALRRKGYADVEERRLTYSYTYGGGATVCFVDDGRRADRPVDLANVRGVLGYYSLPRHWVTPDQPSADVRAAWWGSQAGKPAYYWVNPSTAGAEADRFDPGGDVRALLRETGQRFHASRIIASPYRPELDWRTARKYPHWRGWGPGIVEGVVPVFEARRWGMLRVFDALNGLGYDVITSTTGAPVTSAKSTPSGGSGLLDFLRGLKACRDLTGDGVSVVALDAGMDMKPLTRQLTGVHDLTEEQRKMLLDYVPYPRVVLFGETSGGMNGGRAEGEWQQYGRTKKKFNRSRRWPGMRQAAILTMADKTGPTNGEVDLDVEADFPDAYEATEAERSESRKRDAEARALDAATLGLTPEAMLSLDPSLERTYPGVTAMLEAARAARRRARVQVPAGPPTPALAAPVVEGDLVAAPDDTPAVTPAAAVKANAADPPTTSAPTPTSASPTADAIESPLDESPIAAVSAADPAALLPSDTATEVDLARALQMTRPAFRKWTAGLGIRPVATLGKGARGGDRYSVGEVKAAARARTDAHLDGLALHVDM